MRVLYEIPLLKEWQVITFREAHNSAIITSVDRSETIIMRVYSLPLLRVYILPKSCENSISI